MPDTKGGTNVGADEYKAEFVAFLLKAGVLKFGDFTAKSGRKTPYFLNAGELKTGAQTAMLGEFYARCYLEHLGHTPRVLYGPAYKGIPIAVSAAVALASHGVDCPFFFNRKEEKDHGEGGVFVGHIPQDGEEMVITEDIITAGTAIRESLSLLGELPGVKVAGAIVMADRMEKGTGERSALDELRETYGFPIFPIVTVRDILAYLQTHDLPESRFLPQMTAYLQRYGARI